FLSQHYVTNMNQKIANYDQGDINIDKQNIYNYSPNQEPPQPNPLIYCVPTLQITELTHKSRQLNYYAKT
ncbi:MAG: hypothetical protein ACKO7A_00630, partial [Microcystis sp.]